MFSYAVVNEVRLIFQRPQWDIDSHHLRLRIVGLHLSLPALPITEDRNDPKLGDLASMGMHRKECIAVKLLNPFNFLVHHRIDRRYLVVVDFPCAVIMFDLEIDCAADLPVVDRGEQALLNHMVLEVLRSLLNDLVNRRAEKSRHPVHNIDRQVVGV